jgi:hypothetical protein
MYNVVSHLSSELKLDQKHEITITSSPDESKKIKFNQIVDSLGVRGKFVEIFADQGEQIIIQNFSDFTEDDINYAHNNVALTCPYLFNLFKPDFETNLINKLLVCVATGEQNKVEKLFKKTSPELMLKKTTFTDYSGRTFNCTAYEYAYWAKDTHMCRMLEKYMDADTKYQILQCIDAIEEHGLKYIQHGNEYCTKHFDLTPLIDALKEYVAGYKNWDATNNYDAMRAAWMKVGRAQRDVPVHVINEYCRPDRSFDPMPKFNEDELPRVVSFYNYNTLNTGAVFPLDLSNSSGLARGARARVWGVDGDVDLSRLVDFDLAAISHLDEVRTADLTQSRENLKSAEHSIGNG